MKLTPPIPVIQRGPSTLNSGPQDCQTRRAFIRAALLTGIAGLGWLLLRRSCAGNGACDSCRQFDGCGLPWKINRP